jgi:hypothetical protein
MYMKKERRGRKTTGERIAIRKSLREGVDGKHNWTTGAEDIGPGVLDPKESKDIEGQGWGDIDA